MSDIKFVLNFEQKGFDWHYQNLFLRVQKKILSKKMQKNCFFFQILMDIEQKKCGRRSQNSFPSVQKERMLKFQFFSQELRNATLLDF